MDRTNINTATKKKTNLNLRMNKIPVQADFHDEFMGKYDEFSQSWRD